MARALGSYPSCHRFESSRRYHPEEAAMAASSGTALDTARFGRHGPVVKRLRHRPFTAVTRVRFPSGSPIWRLSSAGRALASHARGHRFEFCSLHQSNIIRIFSPSGTGSDLLFTWTVSAHKEIGLHHLMGAVIFMLCILSLALPFLKCRLPFRAGKVCLHFGEQTAGQTLYCKVGNDHLCIIPSLGVCRSHGFHLLSLFSKVRPCGAVIAWGRLC